LEKLNAKQQKQTTQEDDKSTNSEPKSKEKLNLTRMWANAQRGGRPVEYKWRPLFNAAMFG